MTHALPNAAHTSSLMSHRLHFFTTFAQKKVMKKYLFLVIMVCLLNIATTAQQRLITRGAIEGELYMSASWYVNYYEADYLAILHITENGKKVEINHSMEYQSPDAGTGDALPMQAHLIMADATPGVVYNADWYMAYDEDGQPYDYARLWFSDDYGKTWELRDTQSWKKYYYVTNSAGIIYRGGGGVYKSINFALDFFKEEGISYWEPCDPGLLLGEVFSAGAMIPYQGKFTYTYDDFKTYTQTAIDSQFMFGQIGGIFPDVFRGGLPGEVYITSPFPGNIYKLSFSADTGYHFRVVRQQQGYMHFMSDRKAGDFYIVTQQKIETQQPWGWYNRMCVEHYTDYGETLAGIYCHDLTREGVVTAVGEIEKGEEITVYPNPTGGELRVESGELRVESVEIFDLMGRRQKAEGRRQNVVDISDLSAGMYFVRVQTENGIITKKVVKR